MKRSLKMKFLKKLLVLALSVTMCFSSFACTNGSGSGGDTTVINIMNNGGGCGRVWLDNAIARFQEKIGDKSYAPGKKGVSFEIEHNIQTQASTMATSGFDVYFTTSDSFPYALAQRGLLYDVTEFINRDSYEDEDGNITVSILDKIDPNYHDVLKGADGRSIYSPEVSDLFLCNIRECLKDGNLKEIEYPLEVEGSKHYFQARIAPFEGNTVLALIHDIGDRIRRSEELIEAKRRAEDADRMKSVFLANMSHEIRTPLNAIVGFSEIMVLTENEEEKHEYLEIIQKNSNLLLQLINDILDLSRIESGKSEMHFQQVEIAGLVDEVEKVHQLKMKLNVDLKVVRPQGEFWTSTDRNRVMQVLFNFLSNAIKNTETGSITLGLKQEGDWLKLFVSDTGCGIPEEKLPQIFTRFEKLNDFVQGTGLGLSICKSIVERLGGRIEVSSELGQGSTFALYLPYQEIPVEVAERSLSTKIDSESVRHKKILVVEDIESNFAQLNILLKKEYTILWVRNGQEAINSFIREKPDLILMDIRMPVMDGIQATEKIRTISLSVPIIAVTAYAFYTEQQQAIQAGCNAVISKPYSLEKLKETIETYIG